MDKVLITFLTNVEFIRNREYDSVQYYFQKRRVVGKRNSEHHRLPRSRCAQFSIDSDDPRNLILKDLGKHRAYHQLLNNMTPEEAIEYLFSEWFPPASVFDPDFIQNEHLKAYFKEFWKGREDLEMKSARFRCEKCGGRVVEIGHKGKVRIFNCEMCGDFECHSCMMCMRPARIAVEQREGLYICQLCLRETTKKKARIPRRFKKYMHIFRQILRRLDNPEQVS